MELDLSDSNVTQLDDLSPVAWRKINLNQNFVPHIFWDSLPISLVELSAARNEVRHIDIDMPFPFLQTLHLNKNYIRSFRMDVVLSALETLDLSLNWIESLQFLEHMPSLKHLNLSHNEVEILQYLPQSLETLNASHCRIKMIQSKLPPNLKELNLSHNCLKQGGLPLSWGSSLQSLNLSFNQLRTFPKRLPDSVEHINLAMNQIEEIPSIIPFSLKTLILSYNRVRVLPWKTNAQLHILKIDSNRLTQEFHQKPSWVTQFLAENNWNDSEHHQTQRLVKRCWKRFLLKKRLRHIYRSRSIYDELMMVALHPDHILQTDTFSPEWFKRTT
jgi:Leucine-rich repeat (LRR) protein